MSFSVRYEGEVRGGISLRWRLLIAGLSVLAALLFPRFGRSYEIMNGWADQSFYIRILDLVDTGKVQEALSANYMGPSYIAAVQMLKQLFALDSSGALVLLNRMSVALAIAAPAILYGLVRMKDTGALRFALGTFAVFLLSTPFMYSSSIPWSHYVVGLPGVILLLSFSIRSKNVATLAVGVFLGIVATTRLFEAQAIAALIVLYIAISAIRTPELIRGCFFLFLYAIIGFAIGYSVHFVVLGDLHFYRQYSGMLESETYNGTSFRFADLPVKITQFFVDPCFYALCEYIDFKKDRYFVFESDRGLQHWRLPFVLQIPFYVATLIAGIIVLARRPKLLGAIFRDPVLFVGLGAAIGIPLGYMSYMVGGSTQMKFGFVREMFLPALCLLIVATHLLTSSLLREGEKKLFFWSLALIAVIGLQVIPKVVGFPRLSDTHIARVEASEHCDGEECSLSLAYFNPSGQQITIPFDRFAMLRQDCAGKTVFQGVVELTQFRYRPAECENLEITALSTTTGSSRFARRKIGGRMVH